MKFSRAFLILIAVGLILAATVGAGAVLVWGILFVLGYVCIGEASRARTKQGREQMAREQKQEEDDVNYWGSTQYWEDLEEDEDGEN